MTVKQEAIVMAAVDAWAAEREAMRRRTQQRRRDLVKVREAWERAVNAKQARRTA